MRPQSPEGGWDSHGFRALMSLRRMQRAWRRWTTRPRSLSPWYQVSCQRRALDSRDDYILQATEAVEVLNALVHGGVVAGHQIPSMDELSDNLRKLNEGVHDLMTGLGVLAAGGTVNGQNVPGLDTTVSGLKNLSEGVGSPAKGTAALKAGSGTGMGDGHRRRAMGRARSPWAEGHNAARHCCRPKTITLFTDHVAGSCTLSAHLPRAPRKVQEPVQPQSSAAGKSRRKWFLSALPLR